MRTLIIIVALVGLGLIGISQTVYTVDQTEQVIITRFGEVTRFGDVKAGKGSHPGIYFKTPFVDKVIRYENRLLRIDSAPVTMLDVDKQSLEIDSYIRYRITDPVDFLKTLQTESGARNRLDNIVTSALRSEIANSKREQIIGGKIIDESGLRPRIESTESRSEILERVLLSVRKTIADEKQPFGVEIIDVRIVGADFPDSVAASIFTRMQAERNRIAIGFRSDGDRQDLEIRANVNRLRDITLAEAERDSNIARGQGEAQAICIFAKALEEDPEFYAFRRSLDAYRTFLNQQTTIVLSSQADLFRFLQSPLPASTPAGRDASSTTGALPVARSPAPSSTAPASQAPSAGGIPVECQAISPTSTAPKGK